MWSLLDLPEEILIIIGGYLDATALSNLASTNARLFFSAAYCTEHLRIPFVTPHLRSLLSSSKTVVRSLDFSNCYSESTAIRSVIFMCPSIKELNIVNCNLPLSVLRSVLTSLTNLEKLSFSYIGAIENLAAMIPQGENAILVRSPIRHLYVELNPNWASIIYFPVLLNECAGLEQLHIHLIGSFRPPPPIEINGIALETSVWRHLRTVVISSCQGGESCVPVLLDHLFTRRIRRRSLNRWKHMNLASFIYEDGKFNTQDLRAIKSGEGNVLRDAYHIQFESERVIFPWGSPRGLKIDCELPQIALYAGDFFTEPITWSADLVELDLTECLSDLPMGDWTNLFEASPGLEALAIPYCFFPPQYSHSGGPRPPKRRRGWRYTVLKFLTTIKLRRLLISGDCPHRYDLPDTPPLTLRDFSVIEDLPSLEELTLQNIYATPSIFKAVANENVRIVRLSLKGVSNVCKVEEFIEKCVELKYFKLEMTELPLGCAHLWRALAECQSLGEICVGTYAQREVDMSAIREYLPKIIERVRILHIHADRALNRDVLLYAIRSFVEDYARRHPYRDVHFESETLTSPLREANPSFFPGRSLCCISNHIAKVKPIGWTLP